jgi:hypothetical protein
VPAKVKVEIPIRGKIPKMIEVSDGGMGACFDGLVVGQRWAFAGTDRGSDYFDGWTALVGESGMLPKTGVHGVDHQEIIEMFPEILRLPRSSPVVQDYLNNK